MAKEFTQCDLVNGDRKQTSWIPKKFAKVGKVLRLRTGDVWEEGWRVEATHGICNEDHLPDAHDDIKAHRQATGDAPK